MIIKKTFTAVKFGEPDFQGDVFMPGSVKLADKVSASFSFGIPKAELSHGKISINDNEVKAELEIPEEMKNLDAAIGFTIIASEANEFGGRNIKSLKLHEVGLIVPPAKKV